MRSLHVQLLGHVGDHEGLADSLAAGDPERAVPVRIAPVDGLDERLARDLLHGAQHRLVTDPAPPQAQLKHHLFRRIWSYGHVTLEVARIAAVWCALPEPIDAIPAGGIKENFLFSPVPNPEPRGRPGVDGADVPRQWRRWGGYNRVPNCLVCALTLRQRALFANLDSGEGQGFQQ